MLQGRKTRLRVWSNARRSYRGCGPGQEDKAKGVVHAGLDDQAEGVVQS